MSNALLACDMSYAQRRLPPALVKVMKTKEWSGKIFIGGGFIRACVAGEPVNDVDLFCPAGLSDLLAASLIEAQEADPKSARRSGNAITLRCFRPAVQIIHRWDFDRPEMVAHSFDFTICSAVIFWKEETGWGSYCHERFYSDLAAKRLTYMRPARNEDAGGSMLRVLKYYQRGYRIPLDSLGAVLARLVKGVNLDKLTASQGHVSDELRLGEILTSLLVEVDPNAFIEQHSHFVTEKEEQPNES
jgi:hypothetical protein